jgi:hypothetical protein
MDDSAKKILGDQWERVPKELRDAIFSSDLSNKLHLLAQKYHLHIDKAGMLEDEVVLVLMGMEDPDAFVTNAKRELDISPEDARGLARDVNDQIFHPIREKLTSFIAADAEAYTASHPEPASKNEMTEPNQNIANPYREPIGNNTLPEAMNAPMKVPSIAPKGVPDVSATPKLNTAGGLGLPEKVVEPLPALPKNIVADKLRGLSFQSMMGSAKPATPKIETKSPVVPPPAPAKETVPVPKIEEGITMRDDSALSMKSFGIQIGTDAAPEKTTAPINNANTAPANTVALSPNPNTSPTPPETKPAADPYHEPI